MDPTRIADVAGRFAARPDPATVEALARFAELLVSWNQHINLGGARLAGEIVDRHLLDALVAAPFLSEDARFVDVGTGGGLPAIPMALLRPATTVDLFEPASKKVAFLRTAIRELGLAGRATVHQARVTAPLPEGLAGRFDAACSRATLAPVEWLALGTALVRPGGRVIVFATGREQPPLPAAWKEMEYAARRRLMVYETQRST